jgi:hypothetical protein
LNGFEFVAADLAKFSQTGHRNGCPDRPIGPFKTRITEFYPQRYTSSEAAGSTKTVEPPVQMRPVAPAIL